MGQVNVNTPGGGTAGEPAGSSGAGFILGIIIAIIDIAVLVYVLVLSPPGNGGNGGGDGGNGGDDPVDPVPSALMVTHRARPRGNRQRALDAPATAGASVCSGVHGRAIGRSGGHASTGASVCWLPAAPEISTIPRPAPRPGRL